MAAPTVPLEQEALALVDEAQGLTITTMQDYEQADAYLSRNKAMQRAWSDFTQPSVDAANAAADAARSVRDKILKPLREWEATIKATMLGWNRAQERHRQEAERQAQEDAQLQAALHAESAGNGQEAEAILNGQITTPPVILPPQPTTARAQVRENWTYRIVNAALIPREYLLVDEAKLRKVVKAMKGATRIPGIDAFDEGTIAAGRR